MSEWRRDANNRSQLNIRGRGLPNRSLPQLRTLRHHPITPGDLYGGCVRGVLLGRYSRQRNGVYGSCDTLSDISGRIALCCYVKGITYKVQVPEEADEYD